MDHRFRLLALVSAFVLAVASGSARAADARLPVHLVSADDAALATVLLAAGGTAHPVVLFDPRDKEMVTSFTRSWDGPIQCFVRRTTATGVAEMMRAIASGPCTVIDDLLGLARQLWPQAQAAVAVSTGDYRGLLHAAAFASATGSALLPVDEGSPVNLEPLRGWPLATLYLTPLLPGWKSAAAALVPRVVEAATPDVLSRTAIDQSTPAPPTAAVVANPNDRAGMFSPSALSLLAPLVAGAHHAPLLLTSAANPETVERETHAFIDTHQLHPTHIVLVGDELALRSHRVPDPVREAGGPEARGGGIEVRVELFSKIQAEEPQDYAVGRIVAESASQASVQLARQLHGRRGSGQKPVIFLSNADQVFALGETISRTTVNEVRNVGLPVQAYYRNEITPEVIQRALKQTDLLVWEGHPRDLTLEERGGVAAESTPALVVLQGCYTFDRSDPFILLEKGTQAIVATSAAIYSASGSAFARVLFDALLYDDADLGTAVRNARNVLLALAKLERARNHADWRKTYRAALAFALWGDPTSRAPIRPGRPVRSPAEWVLADRTLSLTVPGQTLKEVVVDGYRARPVPRSVLGGLLLRAGGTAERQVKELYFTARSTPPDRSTACKPADGWDVVSLYAPRTQTLTVLARPDWMVLQRPSQQGTFTFPLAADVSQCPPLVP